MTEDKDFVREAAARQRARRPFSGIIFTHWRRMTLAGYADDLTLVAEAEEPEALADQVRFLPI